MTYDQEIKLADEGIGPETRAIIGTLMHQINELHEYLGVVRIAHTIGFTLVPKPEPCIPNQS